LLDSLLQERSWLRKGLKRIERDWIIKER